MALADTIDAISAHLTPWQRVHLAILVMSREDYATARAAEYIDRHGIPDPSAYRYKGSGLRLVGGFNTPMTPAGIEELAAYWIGSTPIYSVNALGIPDLEPCDILERLDGAAANKQTRSSRMPLDTI